MPYTFTKWIFNNNFIPPLSVWKRLKKFGNKQTFLQKPLPALIYTPTECQRLCSFSWTRTRTILRIARLLVSRRDATPCVTRLPSPPLPTEDGEMRKDKTCATPRRGSPVHFHGWAADAWYRLCHFLQVVHPHFLCANLVDSTTWRHRFACATRKRSWSEQEMQL